jgi:cytolysin (calcineurin-like family phosphatase)
MVAVDQSAVKKYNCDVMTVLIYQHNMDCIKTEPDPIAEVYPASDTEIQHNMDCLKNETDPIAEVYSASDSEIQHNMECIKTEPDSDTEVYSASCSQIHLVDIKQEDQSLFIKDDSDVSCQYVCC